MRVCGGCAAKADGVKVRGGGHGCDRATAAVRIEHGNKVPTRQSFFLRDFIYAAFAALKHSMGQTVDVRAVLMCGDE